MNTQLRLESEHVDALKRLAVTLGLLQTRGAGAGAIPSVSAVVRLLATVADNAEFVELVKKLMKGE